MKTRAVLQIDDRQLRVDEFEVPPVPSDGALLRLEACGLCGSDVAQYDGELAATGIVSYPVIPGHEPVGTIEEIGDELAGVWNVRRGDRVAVEPHVSCGLCDDCLGGAYHLCKRVRREGLSAYGFLPLDHGHGLWGGYSDYMLLMPRTVVHRLPPDLPVPLAATYQAIAAGVRWAVQLPHTELGDDVLVLGAGQRGLAAALACRRAGARRIIVTGLERDSHKLAVAKAIGATHTIIVDQEEVLSRIFEITNGRGVDVVVDTVPKDPVPILHGIEAVRPGGMIVIGGLRGRESVTLHTDKILFKEITMRGVYSQGSEAYRVAIELISQMQESIASLQTHTFSLEAAEEAILTLGGRKLNQQSICVCLLPGADQEHQSS